MADVLFTEGCIILSLTAGPLNVSYSSYIEMECHTLTMNTIMMQLSDAVINMLQCSAEFRILIINAHFVADNATHALASSATAKSTFNVEEEVIVIRNGWTPKKKRSSYIEISSKK